MPTDHLTTFFAPPERAAAAILSEQHAALRGDRVVARMLDGFPEPAMILNRQRQVVLANDKLAALLARPADTLVGLRPGEAFSCLHAGEPPGGCGTTEACRYCGAARSIVASQDSRSAQVEECRILQTSGGALDLLVWATPLQVAGEEYTLLALRDTTDEHRRQSLERLFFHDVLNTAGGLRGLLEILPDADAAEAGELADRARQLASYLIEEIQAQRALSAAETGDLQVSPASLDVGGLLATLHDLYAPMAADRRVALPPPRCGAPATIVTDGLLLMRVLSNLLKNAIEASRPGEAVWLSFANQDVPRFEVGNQAVMPEAVRLQVFQRSFSTKKEAGHGLGTYSAKLFTERYLGGRVSFRSAPGAGTVFVVELPAAP